MKLLLDENLPQDLRHFLAGHEVVTVGYMGWAGMQNGALLAAAAAAGIDAVVTMDSGIEYEQNLAALACSVVVLEAKRNTLSELLPLVNALLEVVERLEPRTVVRVR